MRDSFAVFILSHGRANKLVTLNTLLRDGYTGKWYVVVDNEDDQIDEYRKVCGSEHVIVFDKLKASEGVDTFDQSNDRRVILFARNACWDIAKELGLEYFLELDDDYMNFEFRMVDGDKLLRREMYDIDVVFEAMLDFLDESGACTVAFAQGGDLLGGANGSSYSQGILRKAMNSFFCRTDRRFRFIGRTNEDVISYTLFGSMGNLFMTITCASLKQPDTQKVSGGMTETYLDNGTYQKSFNAVMAMPSCVKIDAMSCGHPRIHHAVDWNACVPKIVSSRYRKWAR